VHKPIRKTETKKEKAVSLIYDTASSLILLKINADNPATKAGHKLLPQ
jgi:hypothetical protein